MEADSEEYKNFVAENVSELIIDLSKDYSHILAPSSTTGKNIMPRVAALLDVMQISDIIKVVDDETFQRPIYAGNALSTVKSNDKIKIITVSLQLLKLLKIQVVVQKSNLSMDRVIQMSKFLKSELSSSERPELTSAKLLYRVAEACKTVLILECLRKLLIN